MSGVSHYFDVDVNNNNKKRTLLYTIGFDIY
jgi:hypothetical protein